MSFVSLLLVYYKIVKTLFFEARKFWTESSANVHSNHAISNMVFTTNTDVNERLIYNSLINNTHLAKATKENKPENYTFHNIRNYSNSSNYVSH